MFIILFVGKLCGGNSVRSWVILCDGDFKWYRSFERVVYFVVFRSGELMCVYIYKG